MNIATESQIFELVKAASSKIINGQLMVSRDTPTDVISKVKEHKRVIAAYLAGECFLRQSQLFDSPVKWVVLKVSDNPYVSFPAVEVFRGSAGQVDDWMAARKNERCVMEWKDGTSCQAKYEIAHCAQNEC